MGFYSNSAVLVWVYTVPPHRPLTTLNRTAVCPRTAFPSTVAQIHKERNTHKVSVSCCCDARSHFKCISDQHQNNILWVTESRVSSWRNRHFFSRLCLKPCSSRRRSGYPNLLGALHAPEIHVALPCACFGLQCSFLKVYDWNCSHRQDFIRTSWYW